MSEGGYNSSRQVLLEDADLSVTMPIEHQYCIFIHF